MTNDNDYQLKAKIKLQKEIIEQLLHKVDKLQKAIRLHKIKTINQIPRPQDKELWETPDQ